MKYSLVYITVKDRNEAKTIGRSLVESRLVACVNILDGMESLYWWNGAVVEDRETVMIAKTLTDRTPEVIRRVKELHSYECPCIVALPIEVGNPDYCRWIEKNVSDQPG